MANPYSDGTLEEIRAQLQAIQERDKLVAQLRDMQEQERLLRMMHNRGRDKVVRREGGGYEVTEVDSSDEDNAPWQNYRSGSQEVYQRGRLSEEAQRKRAGLAYSMHDNYLAEWIKQEQAHIQETSREELQRELSRIDDPVKRNEKLAEANADYQRKALAEHSRIVDLPRVEAEFLALVHLGVATEVRKRLLMAEIDDSAYLVSLRDRGKPLTHVAANQHTAAVLRALLAYGAEVEATDSDKGDTALHVAAARTDKLGVELVKVLLQAGARPDAVNAAGQTPVWVASSRSSVDCLRELLQAPGGLETLDQPDSSGWTPLQACLLDFDSDYEMGSFRRCAVVRLLMQHGADAFTDNKHKPGVSAITMAATKNSEELILALGLGKAPNAPSLTEGERAFAKACEARDVEALKACMDHYDVRLDGTKGVVGINSILVTASEHYRYDVVEAALEKDAARRVQAKVGRSVLHEAAAEGHDVLLKALCTVLRRYHYRTIDINVRDATNGMTPLMHAAAKNHKQALEVLLHFDADMSLKDKKGRTALAHAVRNKCDAVKPLLGRSANLTDSNKGAKDERKGEKQEVDLEAEQKAAEAAASLLEEHEAQAASSKASGSKSTKPKPKKKKPSKDDKKKTAAGPAGPKAPLDQDDDQDHDQDHDEGHKQQAPQSSRPGNEQGARDAGAARDPKLHKDALEPPGAEGAKDHSTDKGRVEQPSTDKQPKKGGASPPPPASKATNNKPSATNSEVNQSNPPRTVAAGKAERVLSEESTQSHSSVEGPDPLICPISFELMTDPVIASDGNTYQRDAIEKWFKECDAAHKPITSMLNGVEMTSRELKPNKAIRDLVRDYLRELHNRPRTLCS